MAVFAQLILIINYEGENCVKSRTLCLYICVLISFLSPKTIGSTSLSVCLSVLFNTSKKELLRFLLKCMESFWS